MFQSMGGKGGGDGPGFLDPDKGAGSGILISGSCQALAEV